MQLSRTQLLNEAMALTYQMLAHADEGDWQAVIAYEAERRHKLEQAFATREPLNDELAVKVRKILDLDKGLLEISTNLRDELGEEIGQINRGSRAHHAYQANMR